MTGKTAIERICRAAGMAPVKRDNIRGAEVFVADGVSMPPHMAYWRFGIEPTEFPQGMYATLWWASKGDERLDTGQPLFFDAKHNPSLPVGSKQKARVNAALKSAREFIDLRKKAH